MPNHIHLLMKEGTECLGQIFRRIGAGFVYWYNLKYDRVGHLFQDRFKSEAVEDEAYLLTVMRYIHMNPVKAKLCKTPEEYRYSSFAAYETDPLVSSGLVLGILGRDGFTRFHEMANHDRCLDEEEAAGRHLTDEEAMQILLGRFRCAGPEDCLREAREVRRAIVRTLRDAGGSLRQISRLTGASIRFIQMHS